MTDWSLYLQSLCRSYEKWWEVYTITDVVGKADAVLPTHDLFLDLGLTVKAQVNLNESELEESQAERFGILTGLEKYGDEHILLVGRPGAGKSTALARFLLDLAQRSLRSLVDQNAVVPVLVSLRFYQVSCDELIRDFLQSHNIHLSFQEIEYLLQQGKLVLLIDGINELSSATARQEIKAFRQKYGTCKMIFTTRNLGIGADLGISHRLEMQPLTEKQMHQFVKAYLPKRSEQFLQHFTGRLVELGKTPLLLWMLCSVFEQTGENLPRNLGEVLRRFVQVYAHRVKEDMPAKDESRRWWEAMMRQLAWVMMTGDQKTELKVTIKKREAEKILNNYLIDKVPFPGDCAKVWLEDLLKYHLLQVEANEYISFRHQMIQEYYAAEELLERLPELLDQEFQRNYLNYLKWTEVIGLMLGLVEKEIQAIHVVDLAREVDLQLAAKLSGKVLPAFQEKTMEWVTMLESGARLKLKLISLANSEAAIPTLIKFVEDQDEYVSRNALDLLIVLGTEHIIPGLLKALDDPHAHIRRDSINTLALMGKEAVIPALIQALRHQDDYVCWKAARSLVAIGTKDAIAALEQALDDNDSYVQWQAAESLALINIDYAETILQQKVSTYTILEQPELSIILSSKRDVEKSIKVPTDLVITEEFEEEFDKKEEILDVELELRLLKSQDRKVRDKAVEALNRIDNDIKLPYLIEVFEDLDNNFTMRREVAWVLVDMGYGTSVRRYLLDALSSKELLIQCESIALLMLFSPQLHNLSLCFFFPERISLGVNPLGYIAECLKSSELRENPSEDKVNETLIAAMTALVLRSFVKGEKITRIRTVKALNVMIKLKELRWILLLIEAVNDEDNDIRKTAIEILGEMDLQDFKESIIFLIKSFENNDVNTIKLLNNIERSITSLSEIEISNYAIRRGVIKALIISTAISTKFICCLIKDFSCELAENDIKMLQLINSDATFFRLVEALKSEIFSIQEMAVRMLGVIGSDKSVPYLGEVFKCGKRSIRIEAIKALSKIGSDEGIPFLIQALNDKDIAIYSAAANFLEKESSPQRLKIFWRIQLQVPETKILKTITAIQEQFQYYNHELVANAASSPQNIPPIAIAPMKQKNVIRLVVASPGDVQPERNLLANSVIPELNRGIADERNIIIELARWETDAYPGFHLDGPQALIDDVLQIQNCDILIGIFWKRFGTPTQDGTTGTEHEFLTAYQAWQEKGQPQIMMYFNQKPYTPQSSKEI